MFGFFAVGETVIGSASVDLFFTPTGLGSTSSIGAESINQGTSFTIENISFSGTGSSVVLGNDGLEFTIAKGRAAISSAKTLFGDAFDEEEANSKLNASLSRDGILYQGKSTDSFLESVLAGRSTATLFDEQNSFSVTLNLNTKDNPLFGAMVSTLGSFQTTNMGVTGTTQIGQVLVWGNLEISQNPSYTALTVSQSPSYSTITPSQSTSYSEITPSQSASYSEVTPSQTPSWDS